MAHALDDMTVFREYEPRELGRDGYPLAWHNLGEALPGGIKDAVRAIAGNRCIRCGHPYVNGQHGSGEWTPCDERCTHDGPLRLRYATEVGPEFPVLSAGFTARDVVAIYAPHATTEAAWRILTVHHLDGRKANCEWWNLAALDQRCHLTIQGKVRMDRPWPWAHSDWFRPHAAAWYALRYLGENLTYTDTMARLDELLELGRREEAVGRMAL